jgi:hypothetical protein
VRAGGTIAGLEFGIPGNPVARAAWEGYVRVGLPIVGRLISPGWRTVGGFLGPSAKSFWEQYPLERLLGLWRTAGIDGVRHRRMSFGGGIVVWGHRAG